MKRLIIFLCVLIPFLGSAQVVDRTTTLTQRDHKLDVSKLLTIPKVDSISGITGLVGAPIRWDDASKLIKVYDGSVWQNIGEIKPGANISSFVNNAGYISGGTDTNQVRNNSQLDARYIQTELDPTVEAHIKGITTGDISSWNSKLSSVVAGNGVRVYGEDASNPSIGLDSISRGRLLGLGGGGTQTWTDVGYGTIAWAGDWTPNLVASSGVFVKYGNSLYEAVGFPTVGVAPPDNPSGWNFVMGNFLGEWSPTTQYFNGQSVVYSVGGNKVFSTNATTKGVAPGSTPINTPNLPQQVSIGDGLALTGSDETGWTLVSGSSGITGTIIAGTNITISGYGTVSNPYVINSTGGGGGGGSVYLSAGTGIGITGSGTSGSPYVITNNFSSVFGTSTNGLVPATGTSGSTRFLREDGTWATPPGGGGGGGGGISTLTGDVSATGSGTVTATITSGAVSNSKMANMAANTIKGRVGSTGAPQDLSEFQLRGIINKTYQLTGTSIDVANGNKMFAELSASRSYTFTNFPAGYELQIEITNTGSSTINITFDSTTFPQDIDGSIPAGKVAVFSMTKFGVLSPIRATKLIY